jgi:hypothetical protein
LKYIKEYLVPTLRAGDIVVMDNLSSHKVDGVKTAIEAVKAKILCLPPCSPDLNPIEEMWSKVKVYLRKKFAFAGAGGAGLPVAYPLAVFNMPAYRPCRGFWFYAKPCLRCVYGVFYGFLPGIV